jgi:hypothetical protein
MDAGSIFEEGRSLGLTFSIQTKTGSVILLGEFLTIFDLKNLICITKFFLNKKNDPNSQDFKNKLPIAILLCCR